MKKTDTFHTALIHIAVPVTLQSLLQSSFGVVDQVMTGQLGSSIIAGIGLGSKFSSLFSVLVSAVAAAAGIMISQYMGKEDKEEVGKSFYINLTAASMIALLFTVLGMVFPGQIMSLYTEDETVLTIASGYLRILGVSFIPLAFGTLFATLLRCREAAMLPLYASILAAFLNTGLNYVFIFGKLGIAPMGAKGAAWATVVSQIFSCLLILILYGNRCRKKNWYLPFSLRMTCQEALQYVSILLPILICEFFWGLGENVYASIYGHIGTKACAAMTLTSPIQGLFIGALSGLSQAAGILIGKSLGSKEYETAYRDGKRLMYYGFFGSVLLSLLLIIGSRWYVNIYPVEPEVAGTAVRLLFVFALAAPVKVENMILGGGIIRSGGKTRYVMVIDLVGTWLIGVPLGYLAAFILKLPIPQVYFLLSMEECVRLLISLVLFRRKIWMQSLS